MDDPAITGVELTVSDGVAVAVIDHPPINLLDSDLAPSLRAVVKRADTDPDIRVLVIRSDTPDFFIAHYDVAAILDFPTDSPAERGERLSAFHALGEQLRTMATPSIVEIAGRVGGGGAELAASADMRFGALGHTVLCQMEVPLGILPGGSGTQRLPWLVGRGRALEIILGGDDIDAVTLERWGWLNRALEPDELRPFVDRLARRIASFPTVAVAEAKAATLAALPDPTEGLLDEAVAFQRTLRDPRSVERMTRFLASGGQTAEGELRVGALGGELAGGERESSD